MLCLAAYALVLTLERFFSGSEPIWSVYRFMNYPMIILWDASGLLTHDAPKWNAWFDVSTLIFSMIIGFGIGALTYRILALSRTSSG